MNKLFIYYSLSGNGDVVADYLKDKKIEVRKVNIAYKFPKSFFLRIMTGGFKTIINAKEKIIDFDYDISKYNEIIIGSPIWNDRLSTPISTILNKLNLDNKKVTFILYSGSGKTKKAEEFINKNYKAKIINLKEPKKNKDELARLFDK